MEVTSFDDTDWLTMNNGSISFLRGDRTSIRPSYVVSMILAIAGLVANGGSIAALSVLRPRRHGPTTASPDVRLLTSVAVSDFLVCASMIRRVAIPMSPYGLHDSDVVHSCTYIILRSSRISAHLATLLGLLAIAIDHYSAVTRPLRHAARRTASRSRRLVAVIWSVSVAAGFSDFAVPPPTSLPCGGGRSNYCLAVHCSAYDSEYVMFGVATLMLAALAPMYARVYTAARTRRRKKRPTAIAILIIAAFATCWLPYCLFQLTVAIAMAVDASRTSTYFRVMLRAEAYLYNLIIANCLADAAIYALRLRSVRRGYITLAHACFKRLGVHARTDSARLETSSESASLRGVNTTGQQGEAQVELSVKLDDVLVETTTVA